MKCAKSRWRLLVGSFLLPSTGPLIYPRRYGFSPGSFCLPRLINAASSEAQHFDCWAPSEKSVECKDRQSENRCYDDVSSIMITPGHGAEDDTNRNQEEGEAYHRRV